MATALASSSAASAAGTMPPKPTKPSSASGGATELHHARMTRMSRKVAATFDVPDEPSREHLATYVYRLVKYAEIQETDDHPTETWESGVWFLAGALVLIDDLTQRVPMDEVLRTSFTPYTLLWSAMLVATKTLSDTRLSLPYMALVGGFSTADAARYELRFLNLINYAACINAERHARVLKLLNKAYDAGAAATATATAPAPSSKSGARRRRATSDPAKSSSSAYAVVDVVIASNENDALGETTMVPGDGDAVDPDAAAAASAAAAHEYRHRPSLLSVSSSIPRNESSSSSLRSESAFDVDARARGSSGSIGSLSF